VTSPRRAPHKTAHPDCKWQAGTWSECDAASANHYADWQAMQQVILAYNVVVGGRAGSYKKEQSLFAQLVQLIAGDRESLDNKDGTPSGSAFTQRVLAAIERLKQSDLPEYNLYMPAIAGD